MEQIWSMGCNLLDCSFANPCWSCFFHLHRSFMVISWKCLEYLQMGGTSISVVSCRSCRWKYIPQTSFQLFPSKVLVFFPSCIWGFLTEVTFILQSELWPCPSVTQSTELPHYTSCRNVLRNHSFIRTTSKNLTVHGRNDKPCRYIPLNPTSLPWARSSKCSWWFYHLPSEKVWWREPAWIQTVGLSNGVKVPSFWGHQNIWLGPLRSGKSEGLWC